MHLHTGACGDEAGLSIRKICLQLQGGGHSLHKCRRRSTHNCMYAFSIFSAAGGQCDVSVAPCLLVLHALHTHGFTDVWNSSLSHTVMVLTARLWMGLNSTFCPEHFPLLSISFMHHNIIVFFCQLCHSSFFFFSPCSLKLKQGYSAATSCRATFTFPLTPDSTTYECFLYGVHSDNSDKVGNNVSAGSRKNWFWWPQVTTSTSTNLTKLIFGHKSDTH